MSTLAEPGDGVVSVRPGDSALVVSLPHVGTWIPEALRPCFVDRALAVEDTDWHLERLYAFAADLDATVLVPRVSRYVIDLNRPPDDTPMYPGASNTELCPTRFFSGEALYRDDAQPDQAEVERRRIAYWQPYHDALTQALEQARGRHGHAVLWDGHSIRSEIPWLFEGRLPDLNLGTANGASCDPALRARLGRALAAEPTVTHVVDGRFRGGYITRHYGRPHEGIHAVQMEMCQALYMEERPPWRYDEAKAARIAPVLRRLVGILLTWRPELA